ncbi:MAG TPA: DUF2062 domain-containing protein [Thermoanaerobaculia bacterium]|nr:DUF2062 domain-containing protein [Thermoanaerobaculia bacterium]
MSGRDFLRRRIRDPIHQQLTQGLSPEKIALTVAVGLTIAVNPIVGTTTILCFAAAWALGLNQPIIQAINFSSYALQLLLIFPFIRLGEWLFRAPRENRSLERLLALMREDFGRALADVGVTLLHAFVAWLGAAPLIAALVYAATLPAARSMARRLAAARASQVPETR